MLEIERQKLDSVPMEPQPSSRAQTCRHFPRFSRFPRLPRFSRFPCFLRFAAALAVGLLFVVACSNDTTDPDSANPDTPDLDNTDPDATSADDNNANGGNDNGDNANTDNAANTNNRNTRDSTTVLGDGSLGFVTVPADQPIQLRLVQMAQGTLGSAGRTAALVSQMALADYGSISGFDFTFGDPINDPCSPDSAESLAYDITEDPQVVGIVGPTCSASSVAFLPVISEAGLVTITSFSTTPTLTSDLDGTAGPDYYPGFYRTTPNDILKAITIARFIDISQELNTAAILHTGNAFTQHLAEEFAAAFTERGKTITNIAQGVTVEDLLASAAEIVEQDPDAVLLLLYPPSDIDVLGQVAAVSGMADRVLIADGTVGRGVFNEDTFGIFFTLPDSYGNNLNQSTEVWTEDFLARYTEDIGGTPDLTTWAQAYDATTLLLDAVTAASYVNDAGDLVIDRQGIREWLNQLEGYQGISGPLACDEFGDCSSEGTLVVEHISDDLETSFNNVVFEHFTRN